jgi:hypothetical protein
MAMQDTIRDLASKYVQELERKMSARVIEMAADDNSHYLIYRVLGISDQEGELIDVYQNKGRFVYKYAGAFLEEAARLCFQEKFQQASRAKVLNPLGQRPRQFEIDCLIDNDAIEIKWRDATTHSDHITKEHTRIQAIKAYGYKPIRVMFYYPNRAQAARIQETMKTVYAGVGGAYYAGEEAWKYVLQRTKIDLKSLLLEVAAANQSGRQR